MQTTRRNARLAGLLFLLPLLFYGTGSSLVAALTEQPGLPSAFASHPQQLVAGAVLMLLNSVTVVLIGAVLFPVLRKHSRFVAIVYAAVRTVEASLLVVGIAYLLTLRHVPSAASATAALDAQFLYYQLAMVVLGTGSMIFCALLYSSRLVPRFVAVWGFVGYTLLATGAVLELFGWKAGLMLAIPGGLFELFLSGWLFFKGFAASDR